jgi:hydroxymethylbilane synthase
MKIILGTRGSALARWQAQTVMNLLARAAPEAETEIRIIQTRGDKDQARPLAQFGERGVFTKEIENALRAHEIDAAVHSLKDLPGEMSDDFVLAAILEREDARDCVVSRHGVGLQNLPHGARVGTSSTRRAAQVLALRPDVEIVPLRGNVDTRLNKAKTAEYDAIVIAAAGVIRLGRANEITEYLEPDVMIPEAGQGAIAVQIRAGDTPLAHLLARIDHAPTRARVTAERAFLRAFGGGCRNPIGAYAVRQDDSLDVRGFVGVPDGSRIVRGELRGDATRPLELGISLARQVLENGAAAILLDKEMPPLFDKRIVVTRTQEQAGELGKKIQALGGIALEWNTIAIAPVADTSALDEALAQLEVFDWVIFTSSNGVRAATDRLLALGSDVSRLSSSRVAAVGPATARALEELNVPVTFMPRKFVGEELGQELPIDAGNKALLLRADIAADDLPNILRARGIIVTDVAAYRTEMAPKPQMDWKNVDAVTFASASAVKNLVPMLNEEERAELARRDIFCIGPKTAEAAREAGLPVSAVAQEHTLDGLVNAIVEFYKSK